MTSCNSVPFHSLSRNNQVECSIAVIGFEFKPEPKQKAHDTLLKGRCVPRGLDPDLGVAKVSTEEERHYLCLEVICKILQIKAANGEPHDFRPKSQRGKPRPAKRKAKGKAKGKRKRKPKSEPVSPDRNQMLIRMTECPIVV